MKNDKPKCPKCHSSANVVKMAVGFRCCYCDYKFNIGEKSGQTHL
jgi:ribosomal protein L37AE/L43A